MAKPFDEFTKKQQKAIHQTLKEAHLKSDADWQNRILPDITTLMLDLCEGNAHPDSLMYPGEVKRRFAALTKAYDQLGERLQWTLDDRLGCRLPDVLKQAAEQPTPHLYLQALGSPKNHVMRLAVSGLLEIFEQATGIPPTVYPYSYGKTKAVEYRGTFYPFAVACLAPVFPAQELGSAILTAYNELKLDNRNPASKRAKIKK